MNRISAQRKFVSQSLKLCMFMASILYTEVIPCSFYVPTFIAPTIMLVLLILMYNTLKCNWSNQEKLLKVIETNIYTRKGMGVELYLVADFISLTSLFRTGEINMSGFGDQLVHGGQAQVQTAFITRSSSVPPLVNHYDI